MYHASVGMLLDRLKNGCFLIMKNGEIYGHIFAHRHTIEKHSVYERSSLWIHKTYRNHNLGLLLMDCLTKKFTKDFLISIAQEPTVHHNNELLGMKFITLKDLSPVLIETLEKLGKLRDEYKYKYYVNPYFESKINQFNKVIEIIEYAKSIDAEYIAHGSTGAGNDQVRFDMIFQTLAPGIKIITPIRDQKLSRQEEIEYLKANGIDMSWEKAQYSVNKGLWGTSVGGAETLTSENPLPSEAYPSQLEKDGEEKVTLTFNKGEFVALNGEANAPEVNIEKLNDLASAYAIGRDIHVGDTIIGIKGRVGFEAAAALITVKAHHLLEKHTLTKWQLQHKEYLSSFYGMHLHEGQYLDPVMRNIEAFLSNSQEKVSGDVTVTLKPYHFSLDGITSQHDLMSAKFGSYGEENKAWTADDAKGFIKILGNQNKIYQQVNS